MNTANYSNRISPKRTRKVYAFVLVLIGPDGIEQEIAQFKYAGDAHIAGVALSERPHPPGDWTIQARNA